jgi:hypothetical protein
MKDSEKRLIPYRCADKVLKSSTGACRFVPEFWKEELLDIPDPAI